MTPYEYLKETAGKRMDELFKFLQFPSVSAKSEHKKDMLDCAAWLTDHLKAIGLTARIYPTGGHPVVYAEYTADKKAPTVLYYGHYDVQPPEPLELWKSDPFKPVIRKGNIFARGGTDDKGQVFAHVKGVEAVLKAAGTLPVNVKFLIEGEEEVSSVSLPKFIRKNKKMLAADIVVVSDTAQYSSTLPAVTYGLRGVVAAEVMVSGPNRDVHSGSYGGAITNPIHALCAMVGQLHDKNGKVAVPGFYSRVKPVTKWERKQFKRLPFNQEAYRKSLGVPALAGEKGYSTIERTWSRPALDVNGITGGYQGEGGKTIIPSWASCKITMRLVPDMDPTDVSNKLERYLKKIAPKSVTLKIKKHGGAPGVVVPMDGPWLDAAGRAIKVGFGKNPLFIKEGGSIPIVSDFKTILGLDTLLIGFGLHEGNAHSPNESFRVVDFENGCRTAAALLFELAKVKA
ncbi:MAG: dipeptidase [candidate division Zixibacteria bacterium]|nr:dipeptidase [candidate division Zixibacteria bacterium]